jgi:hypothetical protein
MKLLLLITFCSIFPLAGICQDSTITLSSFEIFSSQSRKMLKTEVREVGEVGNILVSKLKTTDIMSQSSVYAISIGYHNNNMIYIDIEDLDSVITAMTYFMEKVNEIKPDGTLHFGYITKGDVEVSFDYAKWSGTWRFSIGKVYKVLRTGVLNTNISFNRRRVSELISLLNQAKTVVL